MNSARLFIYPSLFCNGVWVAVDACAVFVAAACFAIKMIRFVSHVFLDFCAELCVVFWKLTGDETVKVIDRNFCLSLSKIVRFKYRERTDSAHLDDKVSMRKSSLLKFNGIHIGHGFTKYPNIVYVV